MITQRSAADCVRRHAQISSRPEISDCRTHEHVHLCMLSYRLYSSSIHKPAHALPLHGVFQSRSKLQLWLFKSRVRTSRGMQERIRCPAVSRQNALVTACFPVVRRWPHTTWIRLDKAMRICKDTEGLDSPRSQTARTRNAPTCTEPNVPPNIEHTERSPFSTPSAFTPANPGKPWQTASSTARAGSCSWLLQTSASNCVLARDQRRPNASRRA